VIRLERVALAAGVVGLVTAPWWGPRTLAHFRFFAVQRVEVRGARYLAPATVVAGLALKPGSSVWSSVQAMERRVGAVAGVRSASVSRRLPATLVVSVAEVEPVALADGPAGLVAVDDSGRPLPYDPAAVPVDAPVVERADARLLAALATVRATDLGLFADIAAARAAGGGAVVLELETGRLRVATPLDPAVVRALSAVRSDLGARRQGWTELDGRFHGWVVVRRPEAARPGRKAAA
jgi:cell division septal protein FtsQ